MKKILLSVIAIFAGVVVNAQTSCATALTISSNGTITTPNYTTSTFVNGCLSSSTGIKAIWYKYTPTSSQEFANISSQNDAAAQSVSAQAALIQPGSVSAPSDPYESANSLNLWLGAINAARSFSTPVPPMTPIVNPSGGGACTKLDPKTGCHFGHDEKSHPVDARNAEFIVETPSRELRSPLCVSVRTKSRPPMLGTAIQCNVRDSV